MGKLLRQYTNEDLQFLKILNEAEDLLKDANPRKMSMFSNYLWLRTEVESVSEIRKVNGAYLNTSLGATGLSKIMTPIITELNTGEVPLGFPVRILDGSRDRLRQFLATKSIFSSIHWQLHHLSNADSRFSEELDLSNNVLTLPLDQRLDTTHMEYLISSIKNFSSI